MPIISERVTLRFNDRLLFSFQGGKYLREDILRWLRVSIRLLFALMKWT